MSLEKSRVKMVLRYRWAVFGILALAYFFVYFHRVSSAVVPCQLVSQERVCLPFRHPAGSGQHRRTECRGPPGLDV